MFLKWTLSLWITSLVFHWGQSLLLFPHWGTLSSVSRHHYWGGCYWHVVGRSQGCFETSDDAQDTSLTKNDEVRDVHRAKAEKSPIKFMGHCEHRGASWYLLLLFLIFFLVIFSALLAVNFTRWGHCWGCQLDLLGKNGTEYWENRKQYKWSSCTVSPSPSWICEACGC